MTTTHPTAWIITPPAAVILAAYVTTGRIWIALGIAAVITIVALAAALSDQVQRTKKAEEDARLFADDLDAAYVRIAELSRERAEHREVCPVDLFNKRLADVARVVRVSKPDLRIIPPQRDGSEYEWPEIVRAVEGEVEA
jgi:hypothetical protein